MRLLSTLLNEMKNAKFKRGASRSNYHNPPKSVAEFWADQSDYELRTLSHSGASDSTGSATIVSGDAASFHDSIAVRILLERSIIDQLTVVDFLASVCIHGVTLMRTDLLLLDHMVYSVQRIARASSVGHFALLYEVAPLSSDRLGALFVERTEITDALPMRLVNLAHSPVTCLWCIESDARLYLVPKY